MIHTGWFSGRAQPPLQTDTDLREQELSWRNSAAMAMAWLFSWVFTKGGPRATQDQLGIPLDIIHQGSNVPMNCCSPRNCHKSITQVDTYRWPKHCSDCWSMHSGWCFDRNQPTINSHHYSGWLVNILGLGFQPGSRKQCIYSASNRCLQSRPALISEDITPLTGRIHPT